jgi:beta-lactamase superfamily II metal-dependent hydrolase
VIGTPALNPIQVGLSLWYVLLVSWPEALVALFDLSFTVVVVSVLLEESNWAAIVMVDVGQGFVQVTSEQESNVVMEKYPGLVVAAAAVNGFTTFNICRSVWRS